MPLWHRGLNQRISLVYLAARCDMASHSLDPNCGPMLYTHITMPDHMAAINNKPPKHAPSKTARTRQGWFAKRANRFGSEEAAQPRRKPICLGRSEALRSFTPSRSRTARSAGGQSKKAPITIGPEYKAAAHTFQSWLRVPFQTSGRPLSNQRPGRRSPGRR